MKKIILLMILLLTGCAFQSSEERFVNPLFYKKLYFIPRDGIEVKLTPTKIYTTTIVSEKDCHLIANTETKVDFFCDFDHPLQGHISNRFYRYELVPNAKYTGNCLIVKEYKDDDREINANFYCIHLDE